MKNWEISQKVYDYVNSRYEEYYEPCLRYAPDILTFQLFDLNHQITILDEAVEIYGTNLSEDFTLLLYNLMNSTDHVFEDSSVYQEFTEYLYDKYMIPKERSILESAYDCGMLDRDMPEELAYRIALGFDMDSVKKNHEKKDLEFYDNLYDMLESCFVGSFPHYDNDEKPARCGLPEQDLMITEYGMMLYLLCAFPIICRCIDTIYANEGLLSAVNSDNNAYNLYQKEYSDAFAFEASKNEFNMIIYVFEKIQESEKTGEYYDETITEIGIDIKGIMMDVVSRNDDPISVMVNSYLETGELDGLYRRFNNEPARFIMTSVYRCLIGMINAENWINIGVRLKLLYPELKSYRLSKEELKTVSVQKENKSSKKHDKSSAQNTSSEKNTDNDEAIEEFKKTFDSTLNEVGNLFPGSIYVYCYAIVKTYRDLVGSSNGYDADKIALDMLRVFGSIGGSAYDKPCGTYAEFERFFKGLFDEYEGSNVKLKDIKEIFEELDNRYEMYYQVLMKDSVFKSNPIIYLDKTDSQGRYQIVTPQFYENGIEDSDDSSHHAEILHEWIDSLTECGDLRFADSEEEIKLYNFVKYIKALYLIPLLVNDLRNVSTMMENEEFVTIITNNLFSNNSIMTGRELYDMYTQDYSGLFGKKVVSPAVFINALHVYGMLCQSKGVLEEKLEQLSVIGINPESIVDEGVAERGEDTFVGWLSKDYLEAGKLDSMMADVNYHSIKECFMDTIAFYMLEKLNFQEFFGEADLLMDFIKKEIAYHKKYTLLHPEKINATDDIRTQIDNAKTGVDFEKALKNLYELMGYDVELTKASGDQGADLIVQKNGSKAVIQAKYYSAQVGNTAVQEVLGAIKYYGAQKGIVITNSSFTKGAIDLAKANGIQIIDGNGLDAMISMLV